MKKVVEESGSVITREGADRIRERTLGSVKEPEKINHPSHYGGDTVYETFKVMRAKLSPEEYIGALKFQVFRYNDRAGKKDENPPLQDYKKALWYQSELVCFVEGLDASPKSD